MSSIPVVMRRSRCDPVRSRIPRGRVARSDEECRHLYGFVEDIVQRSLGADRDIRFDKVPKAILSVSDSGHGHLAVTVSHGAQLSTAVPLPLRSQLVQISDI